MGQDLEFLLSVCWWTEHLGAFHFRIVNNTARDMFLCKFYGGICLSVGGAECTRKDSLGWMQAALWGKHRAFCFQMDEVLPSSQPLQCLLFSVSRYIPILAIQGTLRDCSLDLRFSNHVRSLFVFCVKEWWLYFSKTGWRVPVWQDACLEHSGPWVLASVLRKIKTNL